MKRRKRRARYTSAPNPGRTAVYQFRALADQTHLYVGITNDPERRFREHAGLERDPRKWWWDEADHTHVTITWYSTRRQALAVEARLIRQLRPPGNKLGNPDWEATTTWRPPQRTFRGATRPFALALTAWTFFLTQASGAWEGVPPVLTFTAAVIAVVATRVTYTRIRA
jgi:predicted GIY-YIG superfamily endonuclease